MIRISGRSLSIALIAIDVCHVWRSCLFASNLRCETFSTFDCFPWETARWRICDFGGWLLLCRPQSIEIVFTDELFRTELPLEQRAKHWMAMFASFDKNDEKAFRNILGQKQRLVFLLRSPCFASYLAVSMTCHLVWFWVHLKLIWNASEVGGRLSSFFLCANNMHVHLEVVWTRPFAINPCIVVTSLGAVVSRFY